MKVFAKITICFALLFLSCKNEKQTIHLNDEAKTPIDYISFPSENGSSLPYMFIANNHLFISWVTTKDSLNSLYFSEFFENKWKKPEKIASGTDWFVNWADFPKVAKNGENLLANYLKMSDTTTYAYDIFVLQKQEKKEWSKPFKIHKDITKTEHGFVSMLPYGEESFFITWLDGRNTSGENHDQAGGGAMTLRGAILSKEGVLSEEQLLDSRICDCCQTTAAITKNGPVVLYRDRSDAEVRDISIVRNVDGKWIEPKTIHNDNWEIFGCPVNGPSAVAFESTLAVAWFTGANNQAKVQAVFSKDDGETFLSPIQMDGGDPIGRVAIVLLDEENALVSWVEAFGEEAKVQVVKINISGTVSTPFAIADFSKSRASGFPQMQVLNNVVYFAWTNVEETTSNIKVASINLDKL
ncbi:MAG: hypothetical protein CVU03_08895 [Bacteroidetes bacterium HGW-Bacteroidetes-2]|jgi:hypothetical protein|nr:MAG: hypothetical protein CVU03_08895 [Bacteroidetes bacterium HGW-Bacteroidetes-2]